MFNSLTMLGILTHGRDQEAMAIQVSSRVVLAQVLRSLPVPALPAGAFSPFHTSIHLKQIAERALAMHGAFHRECAVVVEYALGQSISRGVMGPSRL